MDDNHVKISSLIDSDTTADVYWLIIDDFITTVNPSDYSLGKDIPSINPNEFFITSGDAVEKTKALLREYDDVILTLANKNEESHSEYLSDLYIQRSNVDALLALLIKARGTNIFLETEWNQHKLLCIPKNPRAK